MEKPSISKLKKKNNLVWLWVAIGLVFVAILAACAGAPASESAKVTLPAEVSVEQAASLREQGAFVLDVREPAEWEQAHIPGATLIPLGELASRVKEVPAGQEVVVYCRSGNRSQSGRDILKQAGFQSVTSMAGGINGWIAAGLETESGK